MAKYESLRLILFTALLRGWLIRQINFDSAYLNRLLDIVIYARCPPGVAVGRHDLVLRLLKTLYSLKQSGREWYEVLRNFLIAKLHFRQADFDPCVFLTEELILGIYIDNVLITGTKKSINSFLRNIKARFTFKDLRRPKLLLSLKIKYVENSLRLHQRTYYNAVLKRYSMDRLNCQKTPLNPNSFPARTTPNTPVNAKR